MASRQGCCLDKYQVLDFALKLDRPPKVPSDSAHLKTHLFAISLEVEDISGTTTIISR